MQAAGSADRGGIAAHVMAVANGPGEPILPGELAKGLQILAEGGEVDYVGASAVELTDVGEAAGSYAVMEVEGRRLRDEGNPLDRARRTAARPGMTGSPAASPAPAGGAQATPAMIRVENLHLHFGGIRAVDGGHA